MVRDLMKVLACFDWITPAEILIRRVAAGPSHRFLVPEGHGWSGGQVVGMLRERGGISSYGYMVLNNHYHFCVPIAQAQHAQYLLDRAGVPVLNPVHGPRDRRTARRGAPAGKDLLSELDRLERRITKALRF